MPFKYPSIQDRLLANSVRADNLGWYDWEYGGSFCWVWIGSVNSRGYPQFTRRMCGKIKRLFAHRESLKVFVGVESDYQVGQHLCNRPRCINPAHLKNGSQSENMIQCINEGRHNLIKLEINSEL